MTAVFCTAVMHATGSHLHTDEAYVIIGTTVASYSCVKESYGRQPKALIWQLIYQKLYLQTVQQPLQSQHNPDVVSITHPYTYIVCIDKSCIE